MTDCRSMGQNVPTSDLLVCNVKFPKFISEFYYKVFTGCTYDSNDRLICRIKNLMEL